MQNPYSIFPEIESSDLLLRKIKEEDLPDLLKIYSDKDAAKSFNTDNCHGDDFFYRTIERVRQALDFWNYSYLNKFFVRWAIVDKTSGVVIGTIEQFHRDSTEDPFTNCSLLRLLLTIGTINDMYTEMQNDENQGSYSTLASQDDMDRF